MKVKLTLEGAKPIIITDEHDDSFCGIPVAVVDGKAYGPTAVLPIWPSDDIFAFVHESAKVAVASAVSRNGLIGKERDFVERFCENN